MSINDLLATTNSDYPSVELTAGELQARVSKEMKLPLSRRIYFKIQRFSDSASEVLENIRIYLNNMIYSAECLFENMRPQKINSMMDLYSEVQKGMPVPLGPREMNRLGIGLLCDENGLATINQHKRMLARSGYKNPEVQLPIANHSCKVKASLERYNPKNPQHTKIMIFWMERPTDYEMEYSNRG